MLDLGPVSGLNGNFSFLVYDTGLRSFLPNKVGAGGRGLKDMMHKKHMWLTVCKMPLASLPSPYTRATPPSRARPLVPLLSNLDWLQGLACLSSPIQINNTFFSLSKYVPCDIWDFLIPKIIFCCLFEIQIQLGRLCFILWEQLYSYTQPQEWG